MAGGPVLSERMRFHRESKGLRRGAALGFGFGAWNLLVTWLDPLLDDTPATLLLFYGPMFAAWGIAAFLASRRSGRLVDGIATGALAAFATFLVFDVMNLVRVNLFLDTIRQRADWQNLMLRSHASGFQSLRAFANYDYLAGAPLKIAVATAIGAFVGVTAGSVAAWTAGWRRAEASRE